MPLLGSEQRAGHSLSHALAVHSGRENAPSIARSLAREVEIAPLRMEESLRVAGDTYGRAGTRLYSDDHCVFCIKALHLLTKGRQSLTQRLQNASWENFGKFGRA